MEKWLKDNIGSIWWCVKVGIIVGAVLGVVDFFFYETAGKLAATHVDMRSPFLGDQLAHAACKYALYKISQ